MMYKHTTKNVGQIGRELGVDYVLESSVRRDGDQVRITVQLIYVKTQGHVWAHSYDREVRHSIAVQEEVARAVAQQIRVKLANREAVQRPLNPAANEAYLRADIFGTSSRKTDSAKPLPTLTKPSQQILSSPPPIPGFRIPTRSL